MADTETPESRDPANQGGPALPEPVSREAWRSPLNRSIAVTILTLAVAANLWMVFAARPAGVPDYVRWIVIVLGDLVALWCSLYVLFRPRQTLFDHTDRTLGATRPEDYRRWNLGPLPCGADPRDLYLDQVKRAVTNLLYEDRPFWFYDHQNEPALAGGFSLRRRVHGEDSPTSAHTMIGIRRLDHLQECIETVLDERIAGDLIETGSYRGGATIFLRALLKAHGITNRRVFVCDTFVPPSPPQPPVVIMPIIQALATIPSRSWQRQFFMFLQRLPKAYQAFPDVADPSDELVRFLLWNLRNPVGFNHVDTTSLESVQSNFARYGLLDEQVVFLQGFFAETLPQASFDQFAVIRLDGDTYESTRDAIIPLYPKLAKGGYLIVDDYGSFSDCRRAIQEYREEHQIHDAIERIDNLAVYWRKS